MCDGGSYAARVESDRVDSRGVANNNAAAITTLCITQDVTTPLTRD
jgi:hypothetical protein